MTIEVSILIAVIGCFVGLAGWIKNRDGKISTDAEWKGNVNAKLDVIVGISKDVEVVEARLGKLENRVTAIENKNGVIK